MGESGGRGGGRQGGKKATALKTDLRVAQLRSDPSLRHQEGETGDLWRCLTCFRGDAGAPQAPGDGASPSGGDRSSPLCTPESGSAQTWRRRWRSRHLRPPASSWPSLVPGEETGTGVMLEATVCSPLSPNLTVLAPNKIFFF